MNSEDIAINCEGVLEIVEVVQPFGQHPLQVGIISGVQSAANRWKKVHVKSTPESFEILCWYLEIAHFVAGNGAVIAS